MSTTIKKEEVVNNSNQPQQTMKIRKHIEDYDYFITMGRYVDGKLSQQEIKDLEEDIKSWELFRITSLIGWSSSDIDGVPTPILKKRMRDINFWDFNGGEDESKYISCFNVKQFTEDDDNQKLHKSVVDEYGGKFKNIGEYYRTLRYQSMIYEINYRMNK